MMKFAKDRDASRDTGWRFEETRYLMFNTVYTRLDQTWFRINNNEASVCFDARKQECWINRVRQNRITLSFLLNARTSSDKRPSWVTRINSYTGVEVSIVLDDSRIIWLQNIQLLRGKNSFVLYIWSADLL